MKLTTISTWSSIRASGSVSNPEPKDIVRMIATGDTDSLRSLGPEMLGHNYSKFGYGNSLLKVIIRISPPGSMNEALQIALKAGAEPSTEEIVALNKKIAYFRSKRIVHTAKNIDREGNLADSVLALKRAMASKQSADAIAAGSQMPATHTETARGSYESASGLRISAIRRALDNADVQGLSRALSTLSKSTGTTGPLSADYGDGMQKASLLSRIVDLHFRNGLDPSPTIKLVELALSRGAVPDYDLLRRVAAMNNAAVNFKEGDPAKIFPETLFTVLLPMRK